VGVNGNGTPSFNIAFQICGGFGHVDSS